MSLTNTNAMVNVSAVTLVWPTGNTNTTLNLVEVDDIETDRSCEILKRYGDAKFYPSVVVTVKGTRTLKIMGAARAQLASVPQSTPITVTWNELDAANGAATGGGGLAWTAVNAVCHKNPFKMPNNQFGTGELDFECRGATNDADPITYAPL